jgi:succinyl-diaminopimelate desuccinylase
MTIDVTNFALELISKKSVSGTPDEGAIALIKTSLEKYGFKSYQQNFSGDGSYDVLNLYSEYGSTGKNLCFAGHTDVVPSGDEASWTTPPFSPQIKNGYLIGRGAVDMKGSIAAWVSALSEFLTENPNFNKGKLSFLITGDEEADSINGTVKMLKFITEKNIKLDSCIVGEPTSTEKLGDMIKIGRRGSLSFILTVYGVQGHVAYPEKVVNPNTILVKILNHLISKKLDKGNKYFGASNLEITSIDVANPTGNLVPEKATAKFNIRFNNLHTAKSLKKYVAGVCNKYAKKYEIETRKGECESFLSRAGALADIVERSISQTIGIKTVKSTTGGTSDARFIKDYCEVVEFGLLNNTAHKIDEKTSVEDLINLKNTYKKIIENYFG